MGSTLVSKKLAGLGAALIGQLLCLALQRSIPIWVDCPMVALIQERDAVTGVMVEKEGKRTAIPAKAIILAAGPSPGTWKCARNTTHTITIDWTAATEGDLASPSRQEWPSARRPL